MPVSKIPDVAWTWPIGKSWQTPYIVRYASNLDDGPEHGAPLGGFGAGCIGRSPNGTFNLWHLDGGEHIFQTFPGCQFSVFEQLASGESQAYAMTTDDGLVGGESYPRGGRGLRHERSAERDAERGGFGDGEDKGDGEGGDNTLRDPDSKAQNTLREAAKASTKLKTYNSPRVGTYHALYPRSWYTYENVFHAELTCEQLTPIWADNYQESSYPVAVFVWTAHNPTDQPITLSIMLSWQNMVGWFTNANKSPEVQQRDDGSPFYEYKPPLGKSTGNFNQLVEKGDFTGCIMDGSWSGAPSEGDGQFCIATAKPRQTAGETSAPTIAASPCLPLSAASPSPFPLRPLPTTTHHIHWHPTDPALWQAFSTDGILPNVADTTSILMEPEMPEQLGCAIATRFTLQPGETLEIPFVLSWDLPVTEFAAGKQAYRRYTDFFDRSGRNAWAIAQTALENYSTWQAKIEQWQQPILDRADLPAWFKMALFNELYDLTSGGTLWSAASEQDPVGQFAVLECMDYRWYESLDVRLYGGFATLMLWPELEKSVIRAFARAIPTQDSKLRIIGYYYTIGDTEHKAIRKAKGATPHDLGAPNEHPWVATNYTSYQDCNQWKDLPSDFVIQVYRAFALTGGEDVAFLAECWPAVVETLKYLKQFDQDSDGIPENGGAPDQTFDDWQLKGISAYCGGLWLAALQSAIAIANVLETHHQAPGNVAVLRSQYQRWYDQGRTIFHKKLWNGEYYRLDTGSGSDVVMADQLCGQFMAQLVGLPDIVSPEFAESALDAVYDACFVKFNEYAAQHVAPQNQKFEGAQTGHFSATALGMKIGAANGVRPDGSPQNPDDTHQLEVWTGINFGLAAYLAYLGKPDQALAIAEAVVSQVYEFGLQFRTPEAITALGTFRACHYLRPLAIWGLYDTLTQSFTNLKSSL